MRKAWKWIRGTRKRKVAAGVLSTFLVAGGALAFYAGILNDGTGSATYPGTFGANSGGTATFTISANSAVTPYWNNQGLQPATACFKTSGGQYQPNANCGPFNLMANMSQTTHGGGIQTVTLTGVAVPQGCPEDSIRLIWPDGTWSGFDNNNNPIGTEPSATYNFSANGGPISFTAGDTAVEMFPPSGSNGPTQAGQPLIWFFDDGANQNACAGDGGHGAGDTTGQVTLSFSAHATYS